MDNTPMPSQDESPPEKPFNIEDHFDIEEVDEDEFESSSPIRPFDCEFCFDKFTKERQLNDHLLKWHMMSMTYEKVNKILSAREPRLKQTSKEDNLKKSLKETRECESKKVEAIARNTKINFGKENEKAQEAVVDQETFSCEHCRRTFETQDTLALHLKDHNVEPSNCNLCNARFIFKIQLQQHMSQRHKNKKFACKYCKKAFTVKRCVLAHEKLHESGMKLNFPCELCDKVFMKAKSLKSHTKGHQGHAICNYCQKKFKTDKHLSIHLKVHEEGRFLCPNCPERFFNEASLADHHQKEHKHISFLCLLCHETFSSKKTLRKHELAHISQQLVNCEVCGKEFSSKSLAKHMDFHDREMFPCGVCERVLPSEKSLEKHMSTTHQTKFSCDICGDTFLHREKLQRHRRNHGRTGYDCKICNKVFLNKSTIPRHMRIHYRDSTIADL